MNAEEFLNIALGGNMNIATLKPKAFIEIMEDYAAKKVMYLKEKGVLAVLISGGPKPSAEVVDIVKDMVGISTPIVLIDSTGNDSTETEKMKIKIEDMILKRSPAVFPVSRKTKRRRERRI